MPAPSFMGDPASDLRRAGVAALERGETSRARELLDRALTTSRSRNDWKTEAACLDALAILAERRGDVATAEELYGEMLETARKLEDRDSMLSASLAVARLALDRSDIATTDRFLESARADAIALGTLTARGFVMILEARRLYADRFLDEAEEKAREAVRLFDVQGPSLERTTAHVRARLILGDVLRARSDVVAAVAEFRSAAQLAESIGDSVLTATARESISASLLAIDRKEDAMYFLELAITARLSGDDRNGARRDLELLLGIARTSDSQESRDRASEYERRILELSEPKPNLPLPEASDPR